MKTSQSLQWAVVWAATQIVSLLVALFMFVLGLILAEVLLYPLALGVTALAAGLVAFWTANLAVKDGLRSPAGGVVGRTEAAAVVILLVLFGLGLLNALPSPPIFSVVGASVLLTLAAFAAAMRTRRAGPAAPGEKRNVLIWLAAAAAAVPGLICLGSLFGLAGA